MKRRAFWTTVAVLATAVLWMAASAFLFVWPNSDSPSRTDAVVVLGPGLHGERFVEGLRLMARGVAPVLVISKSRDPGWTQANDLCAGRTRYRVICFRPAPFTTRGEARMLARLARARRWRAMVIVTSTYHVRRARLLNERCYGGKLDVVGAKPGASLGEMIEVIAHEWGGLVYALTFARAC